MAIELLFFVLAGCLIGSITGIIPGIHANTLAALFLLLPFAESEKAIALIVSMGITHSFVDFIPSIALGAPDSESFLAVLPGHRYLLRGKGYRALMLSIGGGLFGGIIALLSSFFFFSFVSKIESMLPSIIPFALIGVLFLMVLSEKNHKLKATIVIILSGLLGVIVLRENALKNPLAPMVMGFFAVSALLKSLKESPAPKRQSLEAEKLKKKNVLQGSLLGVIAGSTVSIMPSLGPAQAAFLVKKFIGRINTEQYLVLLGAINTVNLIFSFFVLFALGKTRTGIAAALKEAIALKETHMLLIVASTLIAMGFSVIATIMIGKWFFKRINSIPYSMLNESVLFFLLVLVFVLSGLTGVIVMTTSTAIGYYCISAKVKRTNCMAFLMIPTILIYLGI